MKKDKNTKVRIEFEEEHLHTLINALEIYSRLRSGQIGMALDRAYWDRDIFYSDKQLIEKTVRELCFNKEAITTNPTMSYGVNCPEMKDGTDAFIIRKVIEQYLHYKRNDGYRNVMDVSGDGATWLKGYKGTPPPVVVGFNPQKTFPIPKRAYKTLDRLMEKEDWSAMWIIVDKVFQKTPLPKGKSTEIKKVDNEWVVIVSEPYLSK